MKKKKVKHLVHGTIASKLKYKMENDHFKD